MMLYILLQYVQGYMVIFVQRYQTPPESPPLVLAAHEVSPMQSSVSLAVESILSQVRQLSRALALAQSLAVHCPLSASEYASVRSAMRDLSTVRTEGGWKRGS